MVQYIWSSKTHFKMNATILHQLPRIILGNIPSEIIIERKVSWIPGVSTICIFLLGAPNILNKELSCYPERPDHAQIPRTFQDQISTQLYIPVTHSSSSRFNHLHVSQRHQPVFTDLQPSSELGHFPALTRPPLELVSLSPHPTAPAD